MTDNKKITNMKKSLNDFFGCLKAENFVGLKAKNNNLESSNIKLADIFKSHFKQTLNLKDKANSTKWCKNTFEKLEAFDNYRNSSNQKISSGNCNAEFVKSQFNLSKGSFIEDMKTIFNKYYQNSKTLKACNNEFNIGINKVEKMKETSDYLPKFMENFGEYQN